MFVRSRTLKQISYEIYFGLRMYVDSRTRVATELDVSVHQGIGITHFGLTYIYAKHTSDLITIFIIN